jgi:hypothetical protein
MKIKTCYTYRYQDKVLTPITIEELPEGAQFVEGELFDSSGEFVSAFISVVADGIDTMTGIKLYRIEENHESGNTKGKSKQKIVRVRRVKKHKHY